MDKEMQSFLFIFIGQQYLKICNDFLNGYLLKY